LIKKRKELVKTKTNVGTDFVPSKKKHPNPGVEEEEKKISFLS
jgi:hypothetical protein